MIKSKERYLIFLPVVIGLIVLSGCAGQGTLTPAVASPSPQATMTGTPPVPQPTETAVVGNDSSGLDLPALVEGLPTRTPEPTATPDVLAENVAEILQQTGLSGKTLLWIKYADWINLGISLLYILAGFLIGTWLIRWFFPRLVRRTKTALDDRLLEASGNELRWLAIVIIMRSSTERLAFINTGVKTGLTDIYFFLALFLLVVILFRLINLAAREAENRASKAGRKKEADPLIMLTAWILRLVVIILAFSISLTHFGVNITSFAVFLGIIGLAISLAGRDVLADIISGAIILIDRPYRVGDRIDLPSINSWGDVYEIGMRSTKILAIDSRMVILPNSLIGKNEIINYSYPDSSLYDECKVMVAYDNDIEVVGQLLVDTIRMVDGVMIDREIVAWLLEFQENQLIFTIGWWIKSAEEKYYVRNRVNRAIAQALKQAGVVMPYTTGSLNVAMNARDNMRFQDSVGLVENPGHELKHDLGEG